MLNWGVMGAGGIAYVFCNGMRFTDTGQILAVASRTRERNDRLANDFGIPRQYDDYADLLTDDDIDAIYIATIHPLHAEWAVKCAEAGKHLLVEKPISMNHPQTEVMVNAARENDVFLMEAFMYRCHPQIAKMVELVQEGAIGDVLAIRATFGYRSGFNPQSRIYNREMGGGGILDIGCYTASMARKVAGAAANELFLNPISVKGNGKVGPTGVDHIAAATLKFENDIIAEIVCAVECTYGSNVIIYGTAGTLTIPNPWLPSSPCRGARTPLPPDTTFPATQLIVQPSGSREATEVTVTADRDLFTYEADTVAAHITDRQAPANRDLFTYEADTVAAHITDRQAPAMSWADTLGNMQLLDAWREEVAVIS